MFETMVIEGVYEAVVIDSLAEFQEDASSESFGDETFVIFNLTNARDLQLNGAKPKFELVRVTFNSKSVSFDASLNSDGSEITYSNWWNYTVVREQEELYETGQIVQINPQYFGAVYTKAGSETNVFADVASEVVASLQGLFLESLPSIMKVLAVRSYLDFMSTQSATFGGINMATQWGGIDQTSAGTLFVASGNNPQLQGFEVTTAAGAAALLSALPGNTLVAAQAELLWDPANAVALRSPTGIFAWYGLLQCLATSPSQADCFAAEQTGASLVAVLGAAAGNADLGQPAVLAVVQWLLVLTESPVYFALIKGSIAANFAPAADVQTWADFGALQFGTGMITTALNGGTEPSSVADLPGLPISAAPEISSYDSSISLSLSQSKAFLSQFSNYSVTVPWLTILGGLPDTTAQLGASLSTLASTGLTFARVASYGAFLAQYLPTNFFWPGQVHPGPMDPDGTYPSTNSGPFTRRTVKEIFTGWRDPLAPLFDPDYVYYGLFGEMYTDLEEQRRAMQGDNFRTSGVKTGQGWESDKAVLNSVGEITLSAGITEFTKRDELPDQKDECSEFWATFVLRDSETCLAWKDTTRIAGLKRFKRTPYLGDLTTSNYKEVVSEDDVKTVWIGGMMRPVKFNRLREDEVKGIRTEYHEMDISTLLDDCSVPDPNKETQECNAENEKYWMTWGDLIAPMERVSQGAPIALSTPYFLGPNNLTRDDLRSHFDWSLIPESAGPWDPLTMSNWMQVEPISGSSVDGAGASQINFAIRKSVHNTIFSEYFFSATGAQDLVIWPYALYYSKATIKDEDADTIKDSVYGNLDMIGMIRIALFIVGGVLIVLSIPACIVSCRS